MSTEKLSELSNPSAEVVSKFGDPEAFGERELKVLADIQKLAYGTKFYSQEYVSALLAELAELEEKDKRISELERANKSQDDHINQQQDRIDSLEKKNSDLGSALGSTEKLLEDRLEKWQELASNQVIKINELQAKLATPVRLPEPCVYEVNGTRFYDQLSEVEVIALLREQGFTVEGDE